jgi:hypothetical protein
VIVDAADLAAFPADGENFEQLTFVYQVAGVVALCVKEVGGKSLRVDGFARGEIENSRDGEFFFGDGGELLDPFVD